MGMQFQGMIRTLREAFNASTPEMVGLGPHSEMLVNQLFGKYYALTRRGLVYIHSTVVAGVAIPISTTTAPPFGVWNKSDSGKLLVPLLYSCAYVSGTAVQTGIGISLLTGTGSNLATAAPLSAITEVAPRNALIGLGDAARCVGFSATTLTAAATWLQSLGMNTFTGAATVPVDISSPKVYDFEGMLQLPPGNLIHTVGNAASGALYGQTLIVAELPWTGI